MEEIWRWNAQPYNPKRRMVGFDKKSQQLLRATGTAIRMGCAHIRRQDYEYKRNGTRNLFMYVEPKAGNRHILTTKRRTKRDFALAMRYLVDVLYPDAQCIDVVLDNLNTHTYHALVEEFGKSEADRIWQRLCFHYTPAHGSWLNMAEIELSILSRQCLRRRLPDEWTLTLEIVAWENARNAAKAKIHWSFTIDDARRIFAPFYPTPLSC